MFCSSFADVDIYRRLLGGDVGHSQHFDRPPCMGEKHLDATASNDGQAQEQTPTQQEASNSRVPQGEQELDRMSDEEDESDRDSANSDSGSGPDAGEIDDSDDADFA